MERTELKLEVLSVDHLPDLCVLYEKVFGKIVTEDYFMAKFGLFDSNRNQCSTVARYQGQVIGLYGCFLTEYCDFKRERSITLANAFDFILLKEFRGKRIFDHLYLHSLEAMKANGGDFVFGFHSVQTYKFSKRLGWEDTLFFKRFHVSLGSKRVAQVITKLGGKKKLERRLKSALDPLVSNAYNFEELNRVQGKFTQRYDANFFKMKNFHERYLIEVEGCVLWLKYDYVITSGIIQNTRNVEAKKVVDALKKILKGVGIHELVFHVQDSSEEFHWLSNALEAKDSYKISYLRLRDNQNAFEDVKLNFMDMDIF